MRTAAAITVALVAGGPGRVRAQSLSVEQPENWTSWATVPVTWSHPAPEEEDWVGAFVEAWPATYIQWHGVTDSDQWPAFSGTVSFNLLNGRHPFVFRYYRGDTVLATSDLITPLGDTPLQGHLGLVPGRSDAVTVSWASAVDPAAGGLPQVVVWGTDPADEAAFATVANVTSSTYT